MVALASAKLLVFIVRKDHGKIMKILSIIGTPTPTKANLEAAPMARQIQMKES